MARARIIHASVPGRTRVAVDGLRHNPGLIELLSRRLGAAAAISRCDGSPLTGNLLLHHERRLAGDELLAIIETALDQPLRRAGAAGGGARVDAHRRDHRDILRDLGVDPERGLAADEAARRLGEAGANRLQEAGARSDWRIMAEQFKGLPAAFLGGSALLSLATGGFIDALAIATVAAINAGFGFATEREAERTISKLGRTTLRTTRVLRDAAETTVPAAEVVAGDIMMLQQGDVVPADGRLTMSRNLTVDESMLTGESLPVHKAIETLDVDNLPLGERRNLVFRGTAVTGGEGRAVTTATGNATEIGRIRTLTAGARPPATPLERQLDHMSREIAIASGGVFVAMIGLGMLHGHTAMQMLKTAVSLGVAALPEGLPTVATVTLALGIRDMRRRRVIVRRLNAVETLGGVTTLCLDKTGTLTENSMRVTTLALDQRIADLGEGWPKTGTLCRPGQLDALIRVAVLCNEADVARGAEGDQFAGSATETALLQLAIEAGADPATLRRDHPRRSTRHRTQERRYMVTRHGAGPGNDFWAIKGSPDEVLELCDRRLSDDGAVPLDAAGRKAILAQNHKLATRGLRVLGFASAAGSANEAIPPATWIGLAGMRDPLRPGMRALIERFRRAGIRSVMITGDQTATAYALAQELDLSGRPSTEIVEGTQLAELAPDVLSALAGRADVFARVSPAHKLQIVEALQRTGQVVAMTGDGINDTPALRRADIGIAMGSGADSAHEVADLILEDDSLATMAVAAARGRTIYDNVRKATRFLLATNLSEVAVMFGATAFRLGEPLSPMQLLWINLVTDVVPGLALGLDPPRPDILLQAPRDPNEAILGPTGRKRIAKEAAVISAVTLASYMIGRGLHGPGKGSNGWAFTTLTVAQLLHALSSRSEHTIFGPKSRLPANPYLDIAVAGLLGMQAVVSLLPGARGLFGLTPLRPAHLLTASLLGVGSFVLQEALKPPPGPAQKRAKGPREGEPA